MSIFQFVETTTSVSFPKKVEKYIAENVLASMEDKQIKFQ